VSTGPNTISYNLGQSLGAAVAAGSPGQTSYFIARVQFVLLDDSDLPKFNSLGGWKAIGTIECIPFINFNDPKTQPIIARPLRSNYTQYPLVNEAVLVKILISKEAQNNLGNYKPEFYYTDIISVWNAPEHNAVPDKSYFVLNPNDKTGTGKFIQTGETKRLVKAPGDVTLEGRRGGSIRLGSNTPGFRTPWTSATSKPIFVISNNPVKADGPARFEDINKDGSIMMMMSGHNPGFVPASANFDSYNTIATISEKQNVVVTDQKPQAEPTASLVQQDSKPIPADVPVTGSLPVTGSVQPAKTSDVVLDEEELPEREDLQEIDVIVEEVPVSLGTSGLLNIEELIAKDVVTSKTNTASTGGNPKYRASIEELSKEYGISAKDLNTFIRMESAGKYEKATLYRKLDSNKNPGKKYLPNPAPGYKLVAVGLIQFTKPTLQCLGLSSLDQIVGTSYEYQVGLMKKYFACNKSQFKNADKYSLYAGIFYPILASGGKIVKPDSFVLGSEISNDRAIEVGASNHFINGGKKISVADFKRFVDKLFK
jgi:hypothetical protein